MTRPVTLGLRATRDEARFIRDAANSAGVDVAAFLRDAAIRHATLTTEPAQPPTTGVNGPLSPTQALVWWLVTRPGGACRQDAARYDVWELANRITEVEERLGVTIDRQRCVVHNHRHRVTRYRKDTT
jgi:hypothetical protein